MTRIPINTNDRGKTHAPAAMLRGLLGIAMCQALHIFGADGAAADSVRGTFLELNDNGAWSWFMDERVIVDRGKLLVGSVRASGTFRDATRPGWGNVELTELDLESGKRRTVVLHEKLEQDDHDSPGLLVLQDEHGDSRCDSSHLWKVRGGAYSVTF
jgi:hypothetical protein